MKCFRRQYLVVGLLLAASTQLTVAFFLFPPQVLPQTIDAFSSLACRNYLLSGLNYQTFTEASRGFTGCDITREIVPHVFRGFFAPTETLKRSFPRSMCPEVLSIWIRHDPQLSADVLGLSLAKVCSEALNEFMEPGKVAQLLNNCRQNFEKLEEHIDEFAFANVIKMILVAWEGFKEANFYKNIDRVVIIEIMRKVIPAVCKHDEMQKSVESIASLATVSTDDPEKRCAQALKKTMDAEPARVYGILREALKKCYLPEDSSDYFPFIKQRILSGSS